MKQNSTPVVKSALRAIDILEFVAGAKRPPVFAEIGSTLGIPNSSLFYLLNTLESRGYLQQQGKAGYIIGAALGALTQASGRASWMREIEQLVDSVWRQLGETTSYQELRGNEMECLIVKLSEQSLIPVHKVGQRSPLYVFSGGKIFLAEMSEASLEAYLSKVPLLALTPNTLTTAEAVRRDVARTAAEGIGISREEHSMGTIGVSIGLRKAGLLIGTLGVAIPAARVDESALSRIQNTLRDASAAFSASSQGNEGAQLDQH